MYIHVMINGISVADHVKVNATMDITIKDKWPSNDMQCEVDGYKTPHFTFIIVMFIWNIRWNSIARTLMCTSVLWNNVPDSLLSSGG